MKWMLLLSLVAFGAVAADKPYFSTTRTDGGVPSRCLPFRWSYFDSFSTDNPTLVIVGIDGALKKGFSHEYAMKRNDATVLWDYFKASYTEKSASLAEVRCGKSSACSFLMDQASDFDTKHEGRDGFEFLQGHFRRLMAPALYGGFEFRNEGDILEALSPLAVDKAGVSLENQYPKDHYFITGGLEYHEANGRTVGELDVVVADKETCEVAAIGEAKLGLSSLGKAKQQLARFVQFLKGMRAAR